MYLNELIEKRARVAHDIETIRSEWTGREGAMPPDVEEKLDNALADYDGICAKIAREEKVAQVARWASQPVTPAPAQALEQPADAELKTAFADYLRYGERAQKQYAEVLLKTHQQDVATRGGYLVAPEEFAAELIEAAKREFFALRLCRVETVARGTDLGVVTLAGRLGKAVRTGELTESPQTQMTFGKRSLTPKDLKSFARVGRKLLQNSRLDVNAIVLEELGYSFGFTMEEEFMTGNGANQMLGVFTPSADGIPTAQDQKTAATATIAADDVITTFHRLRPAYRQNAVWIMHPDNVARIRKLKSGASGDYVWNPLATNSQSLVGGLPGTICGRPYVESEFAPSGTSANDYWCVVGDFSRYWIARDELVYIQVLNELYARTSEVGYHAEAQVDGMPVLGEAFVRGQLKD